MGSSPQPENVGGIGGSSHPDDKPVRRSDVKPLPENGGLVPPRYPWQEVWLCDPKGGSGGLQPFFSWGGGGITTSGPARYPTPTSGHERHPPVRDEIRNNRGVSHGASATPERDVHRVINCRDGSVPLHGGDIF